MSRWERAEGRNPDRPWDPTIREDGDRLAHVVSYDHHRLCDGRPTQGERDIVSFVTCIACAAKVSVALLARAARP